MTLLFLRWLLRLPFLLLVGTVLSGMLIVTYKIIAHFWGDDIFSEIFRLREKKQQLEERCQKNKDWEWRLKHEKAYIKQQEEEIRMQKKRVADKLKKINKNIKDRNILISAWQRMNEENTLAVNVQMGAVKMIRGKILSRASQDSFAKALKSVSKEFSLVTPDDIEVVRHYLLEQFIDNTDCEAFVTEIFDILVGRHVNCYVAAWMLYTMFHTDLPE